MSIKNLIWTALTVTLLLMLFSLTGCDSRHDGGGWPNKPPHRVVLKPFEAGEKIRFATYWPDGMTVKEYQIEYQNGLTTYQEFRQDGTLAAMKEEFPQDTASPSLPRQTKSLRFFSDDGKMVVLRTEFRPDGTTEIKGVRLANGMAEQLYFDLTGLAPVRYQVLSKEGKELHSQAIVGGVVPKSRPVDDGLEITTNRPNGLAESIEIVRPNGFEDIDFFQLDGVTLKMTVRIAYDLGVVYYDWDGTTVTSFRKFTDDGGMEVSVYRPCTPQETASWPQPTQPMLASLPSSKLTGCLAVAYVQKWTVDATKSDSGQDIPFADRTYKLASVQEKGDGGKTTREYFFSNGRIDHVREYDSAGDAKTDNHYRADGTLERVDHLNSWGGVDSSDNVDAKKGIRAPALSADRKKQIPFVDPRSFVKPPVEVPPPPPFQWGDWDR